MFRQDLLQPAWLETTSAGQEPTFSETALHDVELHDVRIERQVEAPASGLLAWVRGSEVAAGVLRATIYARLPEVTLPPEPLAPPPTEAPTVDTPATWRVPVVTAAPTAVTTRTAARAPSCLWPGWTWSWLTVASFVLLWILCSFRLALVWLGGLALARLLRCLLWRFGWLTPRRRVESAVASILALAYLVLWTMAILNWCPRRGTGSASCCGPSGWSDVRERLEEAFTHDPQADQVSDATRLDGEARRRISLDDALSDPNAFFGHCARKIYLSDDLLFDWNQRALKPGSGPRLHKLARLLEERPEARVRLVGHADASGSPEYNVRLSSQRADEIARWLETEGNIPASRLETVGRGSDEPLVRDPSQWQLNRRVEVELPCAGELDPQGRSRVRSPVP